MPQLYLPIRNIIIPGTTELREIDTWEALRTYRSQGFGENPQMYIRYGINGHNGIDIACGTGTEIVASHDGTIDQVSTDPSAGIGVVVMSTDRTYKTIYWHLIEGSPVVKVGDVVKQGDKLGLADSTGFSTASHLHFGLKRCVNGATLNQDNGYGGAIDPTPYLADFVEKKLTTSQVRRLYALWGINDPEGIVFWSDGTHSLDELLAARMKDQIATLQAEI